LAGHELRRAWVLMFPCQGRLDLSLAFDVRPPGFSLFTQVAISHLNFSRLRAHRVLFVSLALAGVFLTAAPGKIIAFFSRAGPDWWLRGSDRPPKRCSWRLICCFRRMCPCKHSCATAWRGLPVFCLLVLRWAVSPAVFLPSLVVSSSLFFWLI